MDSGWRSVDELWYVEVMPIMTTELPPDFDAETAEDAAAKAGGEVAAGLIAIYDKLFEQFGRALAEARLGGMAYAYHVVNARETNQRPDDRAIARGEFLATAAIAEAVKKLPRWDIEHSEFEQLPSAKLPALVPTAGGRPSLDEGAAKLQIGDTELWLIWRRCGRLPTTMVY